MESYFIKLRNKEIPEEVKENNNKQNLINSLKK